MATNNKNTYFVVKDKHGNNLLCPLHAVKNRNAVFDREIDECVEKDVTERYSGNIDVRPA